MRVPTEDERYAVRVPLQHLLQRAISGKRPPEHLVEVRRYDTWIVQTEKGRVMRHHNGLIHFLQLFRKLAFQFGYQIRGHARVRIRPAHEAGIVVAAAEEPLGSQSLVPVS